MNLPFREMFTATAVVDKKEKTPLLNKNAGDRGEAFETECTLKKPTGELRGAKQKFTI